MLNKGKPKNTYLSGRLSTFGLLILTSLAQLLLIMQALFALSKTSYPNKEFKCTEPSPSVNVPWLSRLQAHIYSSNMDDDNSSKFSLTKRTLRLQV
jgi:hypothetical protein